MSFDLVYQKIKDYQTIIIFGHKRPDGDCYGSQNGLKDIIKSTFPMKSVFVVGEKVDNLSFIGQMDQIEDDIFPQALAIVVDTATRDRISDSRYKLCKEIIKIDHHIILDNYGDINVVEELIPATCLLITKFLLSNETLKISLNGATALYTGTITDTGNFRYRGVNAETFHLAGVLLNYGVDTEWIDQNLSVQSLRSLRLKSYVYRSFKVTKNGFAYAVINRMIIKYYNVGYDEAASLVNLLANIKECPVWALIIRYPKDIRVRIRSNGPNINKLAEKYDGGGHHKAAGASLKSWSKMRPFVKDADALVKEYKESQDTFIK
jgi:hypothetical protein